MHTGIPSTPLLVEYNREHFEYTLENNGTVGGLRPVKMRLVGLVSRVALRGMFLFLFSFLLLSDGVWTSRSCEALFGLASHCVRESFGLARHALLACEP